MLIEPSKSLAYQWGKDQHFQDVLCAQIPELCHDYLHAEKPSKSLTYWWDKDHWHLMKESNLCILVPLTTNSYKPEVDRVPKIAYVKHFH